MLRYLALSSVLVFALTACDKETEIQEVPYNDISFYKDVNQTSFASSQTARAVVKISIGYASGTGFFVSPQGHLVTNNHVVGSDNCLREGCHFEIHQYFQKGMVGSTQKVYAKPIHVDSLDDIALYQLYPVSETSNGNLSKSSSPLSTHEYLPLNPNSQNLTIGQTLHTIGHPIGGLKKVTELVVLDNFGQNFRMGGALIGGQSGSPVVNASGEVVGVVKTSEVQFTKFSRKGLNNSGDVVAIDELVKALNQFDFANVGSFSTAQGNISSLKSIENEEMAGKWYLNISYFESAQAIPQALREKEPASFIDVLQKRCEHGIDAIADGLLNEGDKDLEENGSASDCISLVKFVACSDIEREEKTFAQVQSLASCPSEEKRSELADLYIKVFENHYSATGAFNTTWLSLSSEISKDPMASYDRLLNTELDRYNPMLSPSLALTILSSRINEGYQMEYQGTNIRNYFLNFQRKPNYQYDVIPYLKGLILVQAREKYTDHGLDRTVQSLLVDPNISLDDKFRVEVIAYGAGLLD